MVEPEQGQNETDCKRNREHNDSPTQYVDHEGDLPSIGESIVALLTDLMTVERLAFFHVLGVPAKGAGHIFHGGRLNSMIHAAC